MSIYKKVLEWNNKADIVILQNKPTTLMYEKYNLLLFLPFITQNVWMGKIGQKVKDSWDTDTGVKVKIFSELFTTSFCLGQNHPDYIISPTPAQILVVTPSACCLHNARDQPSF